MPVWPDASAEAREEIPEGVAVLTYEELSTKRITEEVEDPRAGATAIFIGTTRNSFRGTLAPMVSRAKSNRSLHTQVK